LTPTGSSAGTSWVARLERTIGLPLTSTSFTSHAAATDIKSASVRKTKSFSAHGRRQTRFAKSTSESTKFARGARALASQVPPARIKSGPRLRHAGAAAASHSKSTPADIVEPHSTAGLLNSKTKAGDAQAMASTSFAKQVTSGTATTPEIKMNGAENASHLETLAVGKMENISGPSDQEASHMVAVLMTRSDVESVSSLTGGTIAIDEEHSASNVDIRTAIVAAGGSRIELSESPNSAMSRLVNGEVPAAVLALVPAGAAGEFPAIPGFRTFSISLSPRAAEPPPSR
jgi:hypothetical protein